MMTRATAPSSTSGGAALSWGEGLALTADGDMLADEPEPSRAPNHLALRHDDGAATAELHEVDLLIAGAEQQEVRDPEVRTSTAPARLPLPSRQRLGSLGAKPSIAMA